MSIVWQLPQFEAYISHWRTYLNKFEKVTHLAHKVTYKLIKQLFQISLILPLLVLFVLSYNLDLQ